MAASEPEALIAFFAECGMLDLQWRISRCGDALARIALYEAVHSLLTRSTKRSAVRAWGMNVAKRLGGPQADGDFASQAAAPTPVA